MIGHAVLRKIVGADFFAAVARADLIFAVGGILGVLVGDLALQQTGAQHGHGLHAVLLLRTLVGATHDESGGLVNNLHRRIRCVHTLTALARGAAGVDFQLVGFDLDVHLFGLRQHGHSTGAGVDASLRFGRRHTLDAVDAALVFEPLVHIRASDVKNDFLEAAQVGRIGIHGLDLPALLLGVAGVHAVQVGGKQRGLGAARAGADFHDGVARVGGIGRQHASLHLEGKAFLLRFEAADFLAGHLRQLGILRLGGEQRAVVRQVTLHRQIRFAGSNEGLEPGIFARQLLKLLVVGKSFRVAQQSLHFANALAEFFDVRLEIHLVDALQIDSCRFGRRWNQPVTCNPQPATTQKESARDARTHGGRMRKCLATSFSSCWRLRRARPGRLASWPCAAGICPRGRQYQ